MTLILTVLFVFILLVVSEFWWRRSGYHGEFMRKFVHISVGSFVAFWPYFLSPNEIRFLSVAFLAIVAVSKYLHIFTAIHSVQRPTFGEVWFAVVVGLLTFGSISAHVYTAALLTMALADGLAAVVGTRYGNSHRYSVFGSHKSIAGTLTFFVITSLILVGYSLASNNALPLLAIVPIALGASILENVAVHGFDNLVVPLYIVVILQYLR